MRGGSLLAFAGNISRGRRGCGEEGVNGDIYI